MIKVAIVGRPNVGKSSLFNRIARTRDAIIHDEAGTTRDVKRRVVDIEGREFLLYDTGGIESRDELFENVKKRSLAAAAEADIILFVVDGKAGVDDAERKLFHSMAKMGKPIALIVNKIDNDKELEKSYDFAAFGADVLFPVSITHNRGVAKLFSWLLGFLPEPEPELHLNEDDETLEEFLLEDEESNKDDHTEDRNIRVAIIGRVNVGKSSLLNGLTGQERAVVSPIAGTTIDPVDETILVNNRPVTFIDTAGIRRRSKIQGIEKWAFDRSRKVLERADVALLVLDTSEPFKELDERVAGLIDEYKRACIIVLNKWDIRSGESETILNEVKRRFRFLSFAPIVTVSAKSGQRLPQLMNKIIEVYDRYAQKIPTKSLNDAIKRATMKHQIPMDHGKSVKILFATQFKSKPPTIALVMNRPVLHFTYERYLINTLRDEFDLEGTPVVLIPRRRGERDETEGND